MGKCYHGSLEEGGGTTNWGKSKCKISKIQMRSVVVASSIVKRCMIACLSLRCRKYIVFGVFTQLAASARKGLDEDED